MAAHCTFFDLLLRQGQLVITITYSFVVLRLASRKCGCFLFLISQIPPLRQLPAAPDACSATFSHDNGELLAYFPGPLISACDFPEFRSRKTPAGRFARYITTARDGAFVGTHSGAAMQVVTEQEIRLRIYSYGVQYTKLRGLQGQNSLTAACRWKHSVVRFGADVGLRIPILTSATRRHLRCDSVSRHR